MSRIVSAIGIVVLVLSILVAGSGILIMFVLEDDVKEYVVAEGDQNIVNQNEFYLFDESILVGLGVVLGSLPLSILGLALIIMGKGCGYSPEKYISRQE